ncbi:MAG: hypothetical protein KTQ49_08625 [Candidatus Omnitrophica bacterium]|nr:hypothetical protein [Candidatus Omnitrophota bacterium]
MIRVKAIQGKFLVPALSFLILVSTGCAATIHEEKSSDSDPGSLTQLKVEPQKVKLVHSF